MTATTHPRQAKPVLRLIDRNGRIPQMVSIPQRQSVPEPFAPCYGRTSDYQGPDPVVPPQKPRDRNPWGLSSNGVSTASIGIGHIPRRRPRRSHSIFSAQPRFKTCVRAASVPRWYGSFAPARRFRTRKPPAQTRTECGDQSLVSDDPSEPASVHKAAVTSISFVPACLRASVPSLGNCAPAQAPTVTPPPRHPLTLSPAPPLRSHPSP